MMIIGSFQAEKPLQTSYFSELYVSTELVPNELAYCMSLIGMMRCMVEIGLVDIYL